MLQGRDDISVGEDVPAEMSGRRSPSPRVPGWIACGSRQRPASWPKRRVQRRGTAIGGEIDGCQFCTEARDRLGKPQEHLRLGCLSTKTVAPKSLLGSCGRRAGGLRSVRCSPDLPSPDRLPCLQPEDHVPAFPIVRMSQPLARRPRVRSTASRWTKSTSLYGPRAWGKALRRRSALISSNVSRLSPGLQTALPADLEPRRIVSIDADAAAGEKEKLIDGRSDHRSLFVDVPVVPLDACCTA